MNSLRDKHCLFQPGQPVWTADGLSLMHPSFATRSPKKRRDELPAQPYPHQPVRPETQTVYPNLIQNTGEIFHSTFLFSAIICQQLTHVEITRRILGRWSSSSQPTSNYNINVLVTYQRIISYGPIIHYLTFDFTYSLLQIILSTSTSMASSFPAVWC